MSRPYYDLERARLAHEQGRPWAIRLSDQGPDKNHHFWEAQSTENGQALVRYGTIFDTLKEVKKTFGFSKIAQEVKLKLNRGYAYVGATRKELDEFDGHAPLSDLYAEIKNIQVKKDPFTRETTYFALDKDGKVLFELATDGASELIERYGIPVLQAAMCVP